MGATNSAGGMSEAIASSVVIAAQGSIFSRYTGLGCANSVQLLVRLQQAILQPCASYACEVWAPASACIGPFRNLQQLQSSSAEPVDKGRVKKSVPVDIIFQELQQMRWHDFWRRRVCNLRSAKAGHSSNICLSSSNVSVLHKLQTRLARGRLKCRPSSTGR